MSEIANSPPGSVDRPPRWAVALVVGVALIVFLPSLGNEFVYDDHRFVERNESIRSMSNVAKFFSDPTTIVPAGEESWRGIYRPLRTLSFAIDYAIWGEGPFGNETFGYHLQNMLWHALAAAALLWLLIRIGLDLHGALLAVLIFAVHPVQTESVAWITSRGDVLSGALVLVGLAIYLGGPVKLFRVLVVAVFLALALLAKESAAMMPPLIVLIDLFVRRRRHDGPRFGAALGRRALCVWLPFFLIVVAYLWLRQSRMAAMDPTAEFGHLKQFWGGSYPAQLVLAARGFLVDVSALFFPVGNRLDYYPPTDPWFRVPALLSVLTVISMIVLALRWRRKRAVAALGLLWFLAARVPTSNILVTVSILSADRFLYLPLAGLAMTAAVVIPPRARRLAVVPLVLLAVLSFEATQSYEDEETLWANSAEGSPRHLRFAFAAEATRIYKQWEATATEDRAQVRMDIVRAIEMGEGAIARWEEIIPNSALPDTNLDLGALYRLRGERVLSYRHLKSAQGANRKLARISYLMGLLFRDLGEYEAGLAELQRAIELEFGHSVVEEIADLLRQQAHAELKRNRYMRAVSLFIASLDLVPAARNRGAAESVDRIVAERTAFRATPDPDLLDFEAWFLRAKRAGAFGFPEVAIDVISKLRRRDPRNVLLPLALARWGYEELGDVGRAQELYREALALDPKNVEAREGLIRLDPIWYDSTWKDERPADERIAFLEGLEDDGRVLVMRAIAYTDLGRNEEARELLEKAAAGHGPGTLAAVHRLWAIGVRERGEKLSD